MCPTLTAQSNADWPLSSHAPLPPRGIAAGLEVLLGRKDLQGSRSAPASRSASAHPSARGAVDVLGPDAHHRGEQQLDTDGSTTLSSHGRTRTCASTQEPA